MKTRSLLLAAAMAAVQAASAQFTIKVDSLERALSHERDGLKRLEIVWWLGRSPDTDVAERYAPMVIGIADSLLAHGHAGDYDILTKKGSGIWNWGRSHFGPEHMDSTMVWFKKALALWTAIGNQERIVFANSQMAPKLMDQGHVEEGIAMLENGLKASEAARDTFFMATNHNGLGSAYLGLGDYAAAIDHYRESIAFFRTMDDENSYRYLGDALSDMGLIHDDLQQSDSAIIYYRGSAIAYRNGNVPARAIVPLLDLSRILRDHGDIKGAQATLNEARALENADAVPGDLSLLYAALAEGFRNADQLDSALHYDELATEAAARSRFLDREVFAARSMALTLIELGRLPEALRTIETLEASTDRSGLSLRARMDMAEVRYEIHRRAGRSAEALAAYHEFVTLRDSVKSETGRRKLIFLDLKEQQAADSLKADEQRRALQVEHDRQLLAEKDRKRTYMFGGMGVLLVAGGLWNRLRYTRRAKREIEKERDRSEHLLLNILPSEVAQELKEKGEAKAREIDQVSILFTDFKEFTQLSERLSAQELVAEINTCFKAFDEIIAKHGVEKIKTIGDAYMAAGGIPVPSAFSAQKTILAAFEMQEFMRSYKAQRDAQGKPAFEMRVGIHTGPVVAGIVGVKKFQYDIWGDTVNTASRMESSGEVGQVNISEATYMLVKNNTGLRFTSRGKVQAKGKGEMEMYFVSRA